MGLTKKDFKIIADIIKRLSYKADFKESCLNTNLITDFIIERDKLIRALCVYLKTKNPNFDEERFKSACLN